MATLMINRCRTFGIDHTLTKAFTSLLRCCGEGRGKDVDMTHRGEHYTTGLTCDPAQKNAFSERTRARELLSTILTIDESEMCLLSLKE